MKLKRFVRKICALLTLSAMLTSGASVQAQEYYDNIGGYGYKESRRAPMMGPSLALALIALAAVIAIAIQHSHSDHSH